MKRFLAFVLLILLMLPAAKAESSVYAAKNTVKVYVSASTSAKSAGVVGYGFKMQLLGTSGSWARVKNDAGQTGYAPISSLTAVNPNTDSRTVYAAKDGAKAYSLASASSTLMATVKKDAAMTLICTTPDGEWCRVKIGGNTLYMKKGDIRFDKAEASAEKTVYIKDLFLSAYKSADTGAKLLGRLPFGTTVTLLSEANGWSKVKNAQGTVGYCKSSALTGSDPNVLSTTLYALKNGAAAYEAPGTSYKKVKTFDKNASVTAVMKADGWARVKSGNQYLYVSLSDFTDQAPVTASAAYVSVYSMKAYEAQSTSSKSLGTLPFGTEIRLLQQSGEWARVENSAGTRGYVKLSDITTKNPNTLSTTYYAKKKGTNVYAAPSEKAKVVKTLDAGGAALAVAETGDQKWLRIRLDNGYGYALKSSFDQQPAQVESACYVISYAAKAYETASTAGRGLGRLPFGTEMRLLNQSGDWAYVQNAVGAKGYMLLSDITLKNPNTLHASYYAKKDGAKVYASLSADSAVLKTCPANAEVLAIAETPDGKWLRVQLESGFGYIYWNDFSEKKAQISVPCYVSDYYAKAYQRADAASKSLGRLPFGAEMTLVSELGSWAQVLNENGVMGYVLMSSITKVNPNGVELTYYALKNGVKIYAGPDETGSAVETVAANGDIRAVAQTKDGKWLRVKLSSGYGYALSADFSEKPAAVEKTVYAASLTLTAYQSASASSKSVFSVGFAAPLTEIGEPANGWAKVRNDENGAEGYCRAAEVTAKNPNTAGKAYYAQTNVKGYLLPDASSTVRVVFPINTKVNVVATSSDGAWARVESGSIFTYVSMKELGASAVPENTSGYADSDRGTASATIEKVIALAIEQYGKPYVYATAGPNSYDCSGLTMYVFQKCAGISLKRSAQQQGYDTRFAKISTVGELKRGDLICMNTIDDNDLSDHVGIYLGSGKFIHASSGGGKVMVSSITSGYYNRVFSWGLRICK